MADCCRPASGVPAPSNDTSGSAPASLSSRRSSPCVGQCDAHPVDLLHMAARWSRRRSIRSNSCSDAEQHDHKPAVGAFLVASFLLPEYPPATEVEQAGQTKGSTLITALARYACLPAPPAIHLPAIPYLQITRPLST